GGHVARRLVELGPREVCKRVRGIGFERARDLGALRGSVATPPRLRRAQEMRLRALRRAPFPPRGHDDGPGGLVALHGLDGLDGLGALATSAPASASGARSPSAATYARSRLRVCASMSVSDEWAIPARMRSRTACMNDGSPASRTAMSTYSGPVCATVSVTPRLARIEQLERSP